MILRPYNATTRWTLPFVLMVFSLVCCAVAVPAGDAPRELCAQCAKAWALHFENWGHYPRQLLSEEGKRVYEVVREQRHCNLTKKDVDNIFSLFKLYQDLYAVERIAANDTQNKLESRDHATKAGNISTAENALMGFAWCCYANTQDSTVKALFQQQWAVASERLLESPFEFAQVIGQSEAMRYSTELLTPRMLERARQDRWILLYLLRGVKGGLDPEPGKSKLEELKTKISPSDPLMVRCFDWYIQAASRGSDSNYAVWHDDDYCKGLVDSAMTQQKNYSERYRQKESPRN